MDEQSLQEKDELFRGPDEAVNTDSLSDSFDDMNWRTSKAPQPSSSLRNRFRYRYNSRGQRGQDFNWSDAKRAANHTRFCPGEHCKQWLPLHSFGSNYNMDDGMDIYCLSCNLSHRSKRGRRTRIESTDKFSVFKERFEQEVVQETQMREVQKRIRLAAIEARGRFKCDVPVDSAEVAKSIFGSGRFICEITGEPMCPRCFLDHHTVTFELRREGASKVLDVICSECRRACPQERRFHEESGSTKRVNQINI